MKERPILFKGEMVRAILDGRKTQTRRLMKLQPSCQPTVFYGEDAKLRAGESFSGEVLAVWPGESGFDYCDCHCQNGAPGDRLWVKETHRFENAAELIGIDDWRMDCRYAADDSVRYIYECDVPIETKHFKKLATAKGRPSIFMPRWASRITLEIESVRVERLNDISEGDAIAEGIAELSHGWRDYRGLNHQLGDPITSYCTLWESINGEGSWELNPWVWVIEFRKL